jgi:hypothetical protein
MAPVSDRLDAHAPRPSPIIEENEELEDEGEVVYDSD